MKRLLFSLLGFLCYTAALPQSSYTITNSALNVGNPGARAAVGDFTTTGQTNFHAYNAGGSNTTNYWSASQEIPFAFEFFGTSVDSFCVSKNGLLTFDVSVAGTAVNTTLNTNTGLPNTSLPPNTFAYFWEDFASSALGTNDNVWRITRGTAPNRELEIHNFSYRLGTMTFSYFTVTLMEGTNEIIVTDMNYKSNNCTATIGAQKDNTTAVQVATGLNSTAGSPNVIMGTGSFGAADNEYYTFTPFIQVPNNVGVASIDGPSDGCGLSATEPVTITIENIGTATQTSIPVVYSLNGGTFTSAGSYTGSIAGGATDQFTFNVDLSAVQTHNLVIVTNLTGDTLTNNDTASGSIVHIPTVGTFPYTEGFESGNGGWTSGGASSTWELGAPTNTNISSAAGGTNAWVTDLDGFYDADEQSFVQGPCFDFTNLANPEIIMDIYWHSEFSWDGANLEFSVDGGTNWNLVGALNDPVNWYNDNSIAGLSNNSFSTGTGWSGGGSFTGNGSGGWVSASHALTGLGGQSSVLLRIAFGADGSGQDEGFGFDNVTIQNQPANDIGVAELLSPTDGCGLGIEDPVVVIENYGIASQTSYNVSFTINGGPAVTQSFGAADSVDALDTIHLALDSTMNLSTPGTYNIVMWTTLTGDIDSSNDTLVTTVTNIPVVSAFPYSEGFEANDGGWQAGGTNVSWEWGAPNNTDISAAAGGTNAWVTNLDGNATIEEQSFVRSPCFDLSTLTAPEILMDIYWHSEFSWDGANLEFSTDGGTTWNLVGANGDPNNWYNDNTIFGLSQNGFSSGSGWTGGGNFTGNGSGGWVSAKHDLTGLGGQSSVLLRFTYGEDGTNTDEGFAFDNIVIQEKPADDLGVAALLGPNSGCGLGLENLEVVVENFGADDQDTFSISFQVNGGTIITQNFAGDTVLSLDTIHLTLDSLADLSTSGVNNIAVWTTLAGDFDSSNDTLLTSVTNEANLATSYPYLEDWESIAPGSSGTLSNGWITTSTTGNFGWESEDATGANENSTLTGPFTDNTLAPASGGTYMFLETSSGTNNSETDELISPCLDLSVLTNPYVEFYYHMYGSNMGDLFFEINSGGVWTTLWSQTTGQVQTAGGDPWNYVGLDLAAYAGQSVKFRFRGVKGGGFRSDMAVDDFRLFSFPLNDVSVVSLDAPASQVISPGSQSVAITIENLGLNTLTSATLNWEVNGVVQTPANWTGSLTTGSQSNNQLVGIFNFPSGLSNLKIYSSMPNGQMDEDTSNDTLETFLCTPLAGNYMIGPGGDFTNFTEMLNVLQTCGLSGAVTVTVMPNSGPYNEQVIFTAIAGLSATNTLTIKGNNERVVYNAQVGDKRIVGFDGVRHITIDSLEVSSLSTIYGYGFHFQNSSDSNTITNCLVDLSTITSTGSTNSGGIIASGSNTSTTTDGDNTNYSVFSNNEIIGGASGAPYQGIYLNGQGTGADCKGNQIIDNVLTDFYRYGIYLDEADSTVVDGNDMSRPTRTASTTTQFVTLQGKTENTLVTNNLCHDSHGGAPTNTSTTYGLYSTSNDADLGDENFFINNMVYDINNNGTVYGIYNFSSNGVRYYHNTVSLDNVASTGGTTRGFYQTTTASNLEFRNNIVSVTRGGSGQKHGIYLNSTGTTIASDNNVLYVNSGGSGLQYVGRYGTTNYATLANWQTANSMAYDQSSNGDNPNFADIANDDLKPNSVTADNLGSNLGIPTDIFGVTRGITPDPGAIEFSVATTDAGVIGFVTPVAPTSPNCQLSTTDTISVIVKNFGTTAITSLPVSYSVNSGAPVLQTFSGLNIPFNGTDTLTFATTANLSGLLSVSIDAYSGLTGDTDASNDTANLNLQFGVAAPYFEDFETLNNEDNGVLNNGWVGNRTTDPRWEAEDASGSNENSTGTGPLVDHTQGGVAGGIYMFMETSSGAIGQEAELESPCIDLSPLANPFLKYYVHMHGADMGNLIVDIYYNGAWEPIDSLSGQQQPNQSDPWIEQDINLCNYSGIVKFRFRGQRGTGFTSDMSIDDFEVYDRPATADAALELDVNPSGYCQTPVSQITNYAIGGTVSNVGVSPITGTAANITINGVPNATNPLGSVASCNGDTVFSSLGYTPPTMPGVYSVVGTVTINETDVNASNDSDDYDIVISDTVYSRDDSLFTNGIGTNAGTIEIGQTFDIVSSDTLTSVSFYLVTPPVGDSVRVKIYDMASGLPNNVIDSSDYVVNNGPGWYTVTYCGMVLSAQEHFFAVEQVVSGSNMSLGYSLDKYTDSTVFFGATGGPWTELGAAGFPSVLLLRANFGHPAQVDVPATVSLCLNDSSSVGATSGFTSYAWSNGATTNSITPTVSGTYTVTATDNNGCTSTASSAITVNTNPTVGIVGTNVTCNGLSTGAATANGNGGATPYTYAWSNGATGATASGLAAGTYTATVTDGNGCTNTGSVTITEPAVLMASSVVDSNAACNGSSDGGATASATGGTTPYTFAWSSGTTTASTGGLNAGAHTVTVTDANGCTASSSVSITEPTAVVAVIDSIHNVTCGGSDGAALVAATGGTGAYTYSWPSGGTNALDTGLVAGNYIVTVTDANGCTDTASATVTQPSTLNGSVSSLTSVSCNGLSDGAATITATGGVMPYTYAWPNGSTSNSQTGLTAGNYPVTVTDANNCAIAVVAAVTEPMVLSTVITVDSNVSCNGFSDGGATASATGGTMPYTYAWNNSATSAAITGVIAGTYSVTITDANGCTDSGSVTITEPITLASATVIDSNVTCFGASNGGATASATGGTSPYTFNWSNSATTASITGVVAGTYSVTVTDANGCTDSSSAVITEPAMVVASTVVDSNVSCNGFSDGGATASATGGTGAYTYQWSNLATTAGITGVAAGTYSVTITDANGCTDSASVTITEPMPLGISVDTSTNVSCNSLTDGSATTSSTGGTMPYTYAWSNSSSMANLSNVGAGTYTVTITDANGCTDSTSVTITEPAVLVAATVADSNVTCNGLLNGGATASATGGTSPYTYAWSNSGTTASITGIGAGTYTVTVTDANGCTDTSSVTITEPAVLVATTTMDNNVSCNGGADGSATAAATGGTSPYAYAWSSGATTATATGLAAGNYTVTVTDDNGCTATASVTISEPAALATSSTVTDVTCFGGSDGNAVITTTGGTVPYAYTWSTTGLSGDTVNGLMAGSYFYTVTDSNGCTISDSIVVNFTNNLPIVSLGDSGTICIGTSTVLTPGSFTSYLWSNGDSSASITVDTAGLYSVTVTDSNTCSNSATFQLSLYDAFSLSLSATDVICEGGDDGTATVTATGTTGPFSYTWNDAANQTTATASNLSAGNYVVVVADTNGCIDSGSVAVGFTNAAPVVDLGPAVDTICAPYTYDLDAGSGFVSYQWSGSADTTQTITVSAAGTYTVTVTDANGCTGTDQIELVSDPCTGIRTISDDAQISYFPNPTDGWLQMEITGLSGEDVEVTVISLQGRVVYQEYIANIPGVFRKSLNFTEEAQGIYLVRVTTPTRSYVNRVSVK